MPYFDFSNTPITKDTTLEANYCCVPPAPVELTCLTAGEATIYNKWLGTILVNGQEVVQGGSLVVNAQEGDVYRIEEGDEGVLAVWATSNANNLNKGVVESTAGATFEAKVQDMTRFCTRDANGDWTAGNYFFAYFFANGAVTKVAEKSFNTSVLRYCGEYVFEFFNYKGMVEHLPEGALNFSNLDQGSKSHGRYGNNYLRYFANHFNDHGALVDLPDKAFALHEMIDRFEYGTFSYFNFYGKLVRLPEGTFNTDGIIHMDGVFDYFNAYGELVELPAGSFRLDRTGEKRGVEPSFSNLHFEHFNDHGKLESLPEGSFRPPSDIRVRGFGYFNAYGALKSLPEGTFDTSNWSEVSGFQHFNHGGALESLPEGSFNFDNATVISADALIGFNRDGALKRLPKGSFHFPNAVRITTAGYSTAFAAGFNAGGAITEIETNAFSFPEVARIERTYGQSDSMSAGNVLEDFNNGGAIERIGDNCFSFPKLTFNTSSSNFAQFGYDSKLRVIGKNCFTFPKMEYISNRFMYRFAAKSQLEEIGEGSFVFKSDAPIQLINARNYIFSEFNMDNAHLTALPKGSFNWVDIIWEEDDPPVLAFNSFNARGGLTEGNRGVAIKAFVNFTATGITGQISIPKGEYLYVNCDEE